MKAFYRIFLLLIFVFLLSEVNAQFIRGAIIGGLNVSQVDGDEVYGFKRLGLNIGAAAILPFNDKWSISIENSYSQEGSYQAPQYPNDSLTGEYDLRLNYVKVPLMLHYNDKDRITFGLGASIGRLVGVEEYEHGKKVTTTTLSNGPYSSWDYSGIADLRFRLYQKLYMNIRYSYSLVSIRERDFYNKNGEFLRTRDQRNNVLSLRLIYIFNDKSKTAKDQRNENNRPQ